MKSLYIFDLDGTLALIEHRRPILDDSSNSNRWDDFYEVCDKDSPNEKIIKIFHSLNRVDITDIWIWSGRSERVKEKTINWLDNHVWLYGVRYGHIHLKMRPFDDSTPDQDLKRKWYEELSQEDKGRLVAIFDDRKIVVDMWRSLGITCLQVAHGDF